MLGYPPWYSGLSGVFAWTTVHCTDGPSALQWLDRLKETNSRLTRWSLALQQYMFRVEHRAGSKHVNADALSRLL